MPACMPCWLLDKSADPRETWECGFQGGANVFIFLFYDVPFSIYICRFRDGALLQTISPRQRAGELRLHSVTEARKSENKQNNKRCCGLLFKELQCGFQFKMTAVLMLLRGSISTECVWREVAELNKTQKKQKRGWESYHNNSCKDFFLFFNGCLQWSLEGCCWHGVLSPILSREVESTHSKHLEGIETPYLWQSCITNFAHLCGSGAAFSSFVVAWISLYI